MRNDLIVQNHGSICLLRAGTLSGKAWLDEHVHQDGETHYWGSSIVVEPRYLEAILTAAVNDDLTVTMG